MAKLKQTQHPPDAIVKRKLRCGRHHRDRRQRRLAALKKVAGIWSSRQDIPADGLEYQRELRSEWRE
jgi:hypothetical protein